MKTTKIGILGAGAVGLTIAAQLSRVADVYAVCRPRHARAISTEGFTRTGIWGEETLTFPCGEELPEGPYDYLIISCKSTETRAICEEYADRFGEADIVSLQNGIGNEEIIGEYTEHVIGGLIITGFEWQGDAAVNVSVEVGPAQFGRFPRGTDTAVEKLVNLFCAAGVNSVATERIRGELWGKALYNCSLNPLGALMEVPYGALEEPHAWAIIEKIVGEVFAVAKARDVLLSWETPDDYLTYLRDTQMPVSKAHHSSMYQDLKRERPTEIDFMNGAVVVFGRECGIATPVNETLTSLIKFRETLLGITRKTDISSGSTSQEQS